MLSALTLKNGLKNGLIKLKMISYETPKRTLGKEKEEKSKP